MKSKAMMVGLSLVTAALTAFSCAGIAGGSFPTADRLVRDHAAPDDATATLARGRAITLTECGTCHRLFKPREFSPARWPALADDMGKRSGLSSDQVADLTRYLKAASAHAAGAPRPAGPEALK